MIGDVHHEAKSQDIIELTSLPTPGELYEPGCLLYQNELQSIFQKPGPNMSQMLSTFTLDVCLAMNTRGDNGVSY